MDDSADYPEILKFSVSDTGSGIPADALDKIFDRFYQVEESLKKEGGGTGLGLSLTKDLVGLMHGEISVSSEPGKGSQFTVRIPLGKDHLEASEYVLAGKPVFAGKYHPEITALSEEYMMSSEVGKKIYRSPLKPIVLIVEDNKDLRIHIRDHFKEYFTVMESADGISGLRVALDTIPDLVIADLIMPHMDRIELCERLKTIEHTCHIPVIMLTAKATLEDKLKGLGSGADDYVSKSFNMKELLDRSVNLIDQRRKLRERFSREITLEPKDVVITSLDEKFLKRAIGIVEKNVSDEVYPISSFCDEMNMSKSTLFCKLFALTNQSPLEFINTIRLKRAAKLLRHHYGNISTVALKSASPILPILPRFLKRNSGSRQGSMRRCYNFQYIQSFIWRIEFAVKSDFIMIIMG